MVYSSPHGMALTAGLLAPGPQAFALVLQQSGRLQFFNVFLGV